LAAAGAGKPAVKAAAADDDEDIFGDAGTDYKPVIKKKERPAGGAGDDMELDNDQPMAGPAPPPPLPPDQAAAMAYGSYDAYGQYQAAGQYGAYPDPYGGQYGAWPDAMAGQDQAAAGYGQPPQQQQQAAEEPKWRVRRSKAEERAVDFVDDAYGEYYPMAAAFEAPTIEEDEEPVEGKAAKGAAGAAPGAPKNEKEAARETKQKLNSQLQKIEHIMKEKGHDHSGAFGKTPSRKNTGEDPSLPASKKRQRI